MTLALGLLLAPPGAHAQTDEEDLALAYGDQGSVSIATGSPQPLRRAPAVATVITAKDIAAMGAIDLDEVLESVAGLHVARAANVYGPLYVIRGIYSQFTPQTLLLQNGVPMTTMFVGNKGNIWGGYPVEHIARIEVIRGPGSALYGADAYSGVINIITKTAADAPGTQVGVRGGSFHTWDSWVLHGGQLGPLDVAAYLRVGQTDGFRSIITADGAQPAVSLAPGPVNTGRDAVDGNLDLGHGHWRLRFGYKLRDNVGTGAGIASALDPAGKMRSERITSDLSWTDPQVAPHWGVGLTASTLYYADTVVSDLILLPAGTTLGPGNVFTDGLIGSPNKWERQLRLSAFATYTGFSGHSLRFGLGHDDLNLYKTAEYKNFNPNFSRIGTGSFEDVTDFSDTELKFLQPQRRRVDHAYVQDEWAFARDWALTAGVRVDHYSDSGRTTNPRVALVWDARYDLTAKLLLGRAFRAPSFTEQYSVNNPVLGGNPALRPETIHTLETVLAWTVDAQTQVNLSLFRYTMRDIIRGVPNTAPPPANTVQNAGSQRGHGLELELVSELNRHLRLAGNYAYQHSVDQATGQDAGYAPHHHLYARVDWNFAGEWLASTQLNWVADRERAAGDARQPIADFTTVDLTLRTAASPRPWGMAVTLRNLFNADVREPSLAPGTAIPNDLPMARRALYAQVSYRF
ncbi:TonB-dependent receptor plug domain-containing protein [Ideonella sp.]|uniref:TonB-dependent receptor plug domain-containing protein n=1 Tax=Ideonella sp. TaxID=1929293 RepID=UPI0035AF8D5E